MSSNDTIGGRSLKRKVLGLLKASDFDKSLNELCRLPGRQVINPLFSFLLHADHTVRWRAVAAMGAVMENLAHTDIEGARTIMRRLMWSLNDESGGIGWGAPEVMGEAMARHEGLADEYASIITSYADENGNFLEYEALQRGLLRAFIRLSNSRPDLIRPAGTHIIKYLESNDAAVRGLAARVVGLLGLEEAFHALRSLLEDDSEFDTNIDYEPVRFRVSDMAKQALSLLAGKDQEGLFSCKRDS